MADDDGPIPPYVWAFLLALVNSCTPPDQRNASDTSIVYTLPALNMARGDRFGFVFSSENADEESPTCILHEGLLITGPGSSGNVGNASGLAAFDFGVQVKGPPAFEIASGECAWALARGAGRHFQLAKVASNDTEGPQTLPRRRRHASQRLRPGLFAARAVPLPLF